MHPVATNTYKIIDINLPQSYIDDAEARLLVKAQDFQDEYNPPKATFKAVTTPEFVTTSLLPGDTITIVDVDFGTSEKRITELTRNIYLGGYTLTLADVVELSKRDSLTKQVDAITKSFNALDWFDLNVQRREVLTVGEVLNKFSNPLDNKFMADPLVRDESFDPRMLAYDSGTLQYSLKSAIVETNVDSVANKIKINAGTFVSHSYNALSRDEIKTLKSASLPYDPTREWVIPETTITLADDDGVNLYLKVAKVSGSTSSVVVASKDHIEVKAVDDYLHFPLGYIQPVVDGSRIASMLWGNAKPAAGGNTQAGRLTSLASRSVSLTFTKAFSAVPIGRKNIHAYRSSEVDTGKFVDLDVIIYGLTIETIACFALKIS